MNLLPIETLHSTIYLLEYSCNNDLCSYILLDQNKDKQSFLVADLAKMTQIKFSPNNKKFLLIFKRESIDSMSTTNVIIFDVEEWQRITLDPTINDLTLLNYKWPLTDVEWIDDNAITISKPMINELTEESITVWNELGNQTSNIILQVNLPN